LSTPPLDSLLAAAFRAQSEGVFIAEATYVSGGLRIIFVNDSLSAITAYGATQLVGQTHGRLHAEPADLEPLIRWLPNAQPGQPLLGEGYLRRADGRF
jgi:PAS domain-containing protein